MSPLDLHVLGTPPAFVLSQDQTLKFDLITQRSLALRFIVRFGIDFAYYFVAYATFRLPCLLLLCIVFKVRVSPSVRISR